MKPSLVTLIAASLLSCMQTVDVLADRPKEISDWQRWVESLTHAGYVVTQGGVFVMDNCAPIVAVFGTCFGNNAAAPYILPQLPINGTFVDPYYANAFTAPGATGVPSNMIYRLADTDALVTLISLPPKAAYLGYQGYLFTRQTSNYSTSSPLQMVSPDPDRYEIFGSFGNDINNVILEERIGKVWNNGAAVYITTSNEQLAGALVADAQAKGFSEDRIFVEPVGANILTGSSASSDDMLTLIRYALPQHERASAHWLSKVAENVLVFRVSAPTTQVTRFPTPAYSKKVGISEAGLQDSLSELAGLLRDWLAAEQGEPALAETMITSDHVDANGNPYGLVGSDCITKGSSCLGDNQDTDAYRLGVIGTLIGKKVAFVSGVNHARLNNADYVSLAVYNTEDFAGVASASQSNPKAVGFNHGSLSGSAKGVLKALGIYHQASAKLKSQLADLYVAMLSRSCEGAVSRYCIELSDTQLLPEASRISVTQRAYLKPGQTSGANPDVLLAPIVVFRPVP